ncbi:phage holin, LLH family [Paenibacillus sp. HJGM_3]|uniref:phage holin, LLH family n=1 Tax=Paenibacillus sp. HJGM_3 TaxID=3379816 RepID=UPI00385B95AE
MDYIQTYMTDIVLAMLSILMIWTLSALVIARNRINAWLQAKVSESQRELLHKLAEEAFAHAETVWKGAGGEAKLKGAYDYAAQRIQTLGIPVTADDVKAAIHKAWLTFQHQRK